MDTDLQNPSPIQGTAPQKNVNVFNVLISYYVELVETESDLQVKLRMSNNNVDYKLAEHFLKRLAKLFKMTAYQIPEDLRDEIAYFLEHPSNLYWQGIALSKRLRQYLEENGVVVLYQDTMIPPFVSAKRMLEEELEKIHGSAGTEDR